ncbi:receptor-like serine/threonine-protein kinase SD1-8 isoform X2 [Syzygium oleosum]|uniref:receptor-like serine/threonine-protein kinase SD1-8 isoform X2 n=1 Tax=Syzygium oleosum TaxID=219896 RepID=UPI0024BA72E6|nr:receptor-like serine/threonine-protein kinase SD1-8 isoform X2 [Syzygium oleosum]
MATASLSLPRNSGKLHSFLFFCSFSLCLSVTATDKLLPGQDISGNKTLVSPNQVFVLGFFKTGGSSSANYYLGIWFREDPYQKPIWVANREYPLVDSSGVLAIRYDGNLVMTDRRQIPVLINSVMLATSNGTHATLLDSGNFVLVEGESENVVWESFFYPCDTLLPGMRLGWFNLGTDKLREQFLVSWQTPSVPSTGSFALGLNKNNQTELRVWHFAFSREIGYWDGRRFRFLYNSSLDDYNFSYVTGRDEIYFTFANRRNDSISWFVLTPLGEIQAFTMIGKEISMVYSPICENTSSSSATDCFIEQPLSCGDGNNFSKIEGAMPNPTVFNESDRLGISDCEIMCRTNCSCTGFASYRDDGTGCVFYYVDISSIVDHIGQGNATIFIRRNATEAADQDPRRSGFANKRLLWVIVIIPAVILVVSVAMFISRGKCSTCLAAWKENRTSANRSLDLFLRQLSSPRGHSNSTSRLDSVRKRDHELPILSFSCVATSTNNFSPANELGEGGFGPVYKGMLLGHEFAVKRLSRKSGQGIEEFKNEVQLISKLQHRNLVKLLGCCIEREEKILIYEYMENKSLDTFLFDRNKKQLLDWRRRVSIIEGIAQGLLYLHKYSRLRIIHRDLKTSNILLDEDMNPKISDFGMARIFGENEARARTNKVVGTYGYMSPEYAVHGLFSTKSDVFSFGVIIVEIISGQRNTTFANLDHSLNLLGHAWELWSSDRGIELIDPVVANTSSIGKLLLCLRIALLCVQEHPEDRPSMSDIVTVLSNESADLPPPKKPAFSAHIDYCNLLHQQDRSTKDISYSVIEAR